MTTGQTSRPCPRRRTVLKGLAASGLVPALGSGTVLARSSTDFRALVCVYQQGGNDGENMLIPFDARGYANYASIRTPASGLNIPREALLPIKPDHVATPFGFHPACSPLRELFERRQLAVIANVGMLARPSTKAGLQKEGVPRPANLFSHSDQLLALHSGDPAGFDRSGWGGRIADKLETSNAGRRIAPVISTSGMPTFASGRASTSLTVDGSHLSLLDSGNGQHSFDALRDGALRRILAQPTINVYDGAARSTSRHGIEAVTTLSPILQNPRSVVKECFAGLNTSIAAQLGIVARLIEGRDATQVARPVFYVSQRGYDTHAAQTPHHHKLLADLSQALAAFQQAMAAMGCTDSVTTFTLSDFGRTLKPASAQGTDHGWGNYALVLGGSVAGGDFFGTLPLPALRGPDDLGQDGRWIPTTSLEQYGAPLARWMGVAEGDLRYVFPNLDAFPRADLGFMLAAGSTRRP